ncbi:MAG: hypothetical protein CFE24_00545 [Flavobacterium sp. BFFFF2]|nr:MAG: hypothetical protein CFE24_00545 [Flavobacterium sp. BFFFF2]
MFELILKMLLVHLIGDFALQSNQMVIAIENKKFKSKYLYFHTLIHLSLILLITQFDKQYVVPAILLAISHLTIDILTKIVLKDKLKNFSIFILDQALHLISISLFIRYFHNYEIDSNLLFNAKNYLLLTALISVTFVSAIVIKKIMEIFDYPFPNNGIKDAGKYIGMLERLFIFVFIITSFWEGVGFLLAAKSIFRFGDLKENKEIKLTEYILIGTLISFAFAIFIGIIYLKLKNVT